jgi:hypothetical protein
VFLSGSFQNIILLISSAFEDKKVVCFCPLFVSVCVV